MTKKPKRKAPFPSQDEILKFIEDSPGQIGKREIGRAFKLDTDQKMKLKKLLKKMKDDGLLGSRGGRSLNIPGQLPPVGVLVITGTDTDGEILARPQNWEAEGEPPTIFMAPERRGQPALGPGDRVLAKLTPTIEENVFEGRTIRRIGQAQPPVMGLYKVIDGQGMLKPTDRRAKGDYLIAPADTMDAEDGDLVRVEVLPSKRLGLRHARIIERLGDGEGASSISLIAVHDHGIPTEFTADSLRQADAAGPAKLGKRQDLRQTALVTIDGADARDFDDAVFAEPDPSAANKGGWHLIVAIADVANYVRPGDALDQDAIERGNSVYFPDRVVPMLPEALSNGWCSLKPLEERPCLVAHMWIGGDGHLRKHKFVRGLMKSHARLTYEQVQTARDGSPDEMTTPLLETVIEPLYGAYKALSAARKERGVLELELPERRIVLGDDGKVDRVEVRDRFDSHKLIEEFMIAANVAAAETLEKKRQPCMYRIHGEPSMDKMEGLRQFLDSVQIPLAKGQVIRASTFNRILERVRDTPNAELVNQVVLRSQSQAEYNPDNIGHFGLALRRYCHFTSPIRRYADLLVHRALIAGLGLGEGGLSDNPPDLAKLGEVLSGLERRASGAERSCVDRFTASFLTEKVGSVFDGRINGVTRFGLFVTLSESGGDGLVPIRSLADDYYIHDEARHTLRGRRSGLTYRLGESVEVMLMEADPITGSMIMQLLGGGKPGEKSATGKSKSKRRPGHRPKSRAGRRKSAKQKK
ncbi:MAG: ribonuclease R [Alphaproteobacteria bacterium]